MVQFNGMVVTNKGRELLSRALASKGKFIITATALGAGAYSGNLRECEELVDKKLDLILMGVYSEKGSTKITVGITNKNVSESFRIAEIGIYAKLEEDTESILYAYDVAIETEPMPNNSLGTTLELVYDIYFDVSSEVEVALEITDSIAFLTQDIAKREFLKTYIVSGGNLKGKVQLEADKQYLADDGKWYQNVGGDRIWEKSGVPDELLIEISWKTIIDEIAKKENKILVKNTAFNKNFGTAENEVLEGIQLARTLGLEYGGELNNSNTKTINTIYYDTQNKSFFKCFQENTLNYADSNYYEGISNNDLLLKLQNLTNKNEFKALKNFPLNTIKLNTIPQEFSLTLEEMKALEYVVVYDVDFNGSSQSKFVFGTLARAESGEYWIQTPSGEQINFHVSGLRLYLSATSGSQPVCISSIFYR